MIHVTLVPTPVGNLSDITLRALEVLKNSDAIAAEDTRHTGILLKHFGIDKPLVRLDQHTIRDRAEGVLEKYPRLAFVSDAGTPGISDPGAELVQIVLALGGQIEVLPGPTALIPALVLSGLPTQPFTFEGFLPRSGSERKARVQAMIERTHTSAFYESPHRMLDTLEELIKLCGPERQVSITRELSKKFEETFRGTLQEAATHFKKGIKGEIVMVLSPAAAQDPSQGMDFRELARKLYQDGLGTREVRDELIKAGLRKNDAYMIALELRESSS
ncbi:16S rRNA (cytidine(1402)-2'-O)-methyltransferase [Deinococcus cellulosilyticus]|uniref:Ribosomal RNA small subunit methyltransferase I n=1 Tax=Deinococcus cellulosilyticus (strain DSM 18568 / NBRC 106333 / KACC 11606 / 5516J-15) TaxID=1223518 RepID=A0A511N9I0_DEIC1|nr:16S rRNA (cytidine(1402)-2'-O)-methyltransferase [Deinococcus cellulosilyticus]GEM49484.1 ribosomal RNA small subunit methyltransferase I [Deinococcus cellulosilyticus NBRC 106333 = KACC 11606]